MPRIVEYQVIVHNSDDLAIFTEMVNAAIADGWQPYGSVTHAKFVGTMQPMVKYETNVWHSRGPG